MKFSNGRWLNKEGCGVFSPQQAYDVRIGVDSVIVVAPASRIYNKGCTLDGVNLTLRITAPAPEVIRVQCAHHLGVLNKGPAFALEFPPENCFQAEDDGQTLTVTSGSLSLEIQKNDWSMTYRRNGKTLTKSENRDLAYIKDDFKGLAYDISQDGAYMRQRLSLDVGETVYGTGERFTPFVKNGQSVDIWNEDGGTGSEQSYKNIPFYLTNKGYGVFVSHPERVSFEIASELTDRTGFSVPGQSLDYFVINGPSMKEVLSRYTALTGRPALPPAWTFGLWLSTSFTTDYDESTVMSFIDGMAERGIPLSVFHFDCFWMREFHWTDFLWDSRVFPDPKGMLGRIREKGIKVCVWINPYIAQESALFHEGKERGYFLKRPNGDVWQWDMWQPGMAFVDFSNPEARAWYQRGLESLMDMGVDCFKTDFGERIPTDAVYYDGSDPFKMHNYYSYLYGECVFEAIERKRGRGEAVIFARSATAGSQKFPVHWGGDCWPTYPAMAESLRGGLSLTMSGFGYWSHDIGGFESASTPDTYKRWAAFGLLSSHSRLHGSSSYRVPWGYGDEAVDTVRFFTKLKASLMPYLFGCAVENSLTGVPVMRAMVLEFTYDPNCAYLDRQYMLGESLLAAPIFNDESRAEYYLPEGIWTDYFTGARKEGGRWHGETCGYLTIPLYVRPNSIIAAGAVSDRFDYDYAENAEFRIYELMSEASATVYDGKGNIASQITAVKEPSGIRIRLKAEKPCAVRLINRRAISVSGAEFAVEGEDAVITPQTGFQEIFAEIQ